MSFDGSAESALRYASAINGLDAAQQKIVLTASGLSAAEQAQVMEMVQLISLSKQYTVAELEKELGMEAGTLAARLNTSATAMMTEELLRAAIANGALKKEQLQAIISTNTQTGAIMAQSVATKTLGASIKSASLAMLGNPLGWITIAIGLLPMLIKGIGKLIETQKEAYDSAEQLRTKYDDTKRELDGLEKEIDSNASRIAELQDLSDSGKITLIEQEELERLQQTNAELETTIARKKEIAALNAEESNAEYVRAFDKQFFESIEKEVIGAQRDALIEHNKDLYDKYRTYLDPALGVSVVWADGELEQAQRIYDEILRLTDKESSLINFFKSVDFETHTQELIDTYSELIDQEKSGVSLTEKQASLMSKVRTELLAMAETLEEDYLGKYVGEDEQTAYWESLLDSINKVILPAEYLTEKLASLPEKYDKYLTELGKSASLTVDKLSEVAMAYPELVTWMQESGFTAEEVVKHYNSLAESIDDVGGGIDELLQKLASARNALEQLGQHGGNVDLFNRKKIDITDENSSIVKGWGLEANVGDYMTVASQTYRAGNAAVVVTPILPNGDLLSQKELDEYIDEVIFRTTDGNFAANDKYGIVLGVFDETDSWEENLEYADDFAEKVHTLNEDVVILAENIANLIEKGEIDKNSAALKDYLDLLKDAWNVISPWEDVFYWFDGYTNSMKKLADVQAEIAESFIVSAEKAREFAAVYPEILENATLTANGEIQLNEDVVNGFLQGRRAELDAQIDVQIAQLEADKAVSEAKAEFAKAQLELAKSVGEGEGKISKEAAEYRLKVGNALTEALIQAGFDEAKAYALATAAMAQDEEEFSRIAKDCFQDVSDNSAKAAYNMASAIYTNADASAKSIASIAKQAHETAQAIHGMANGIIAGSEDKVVIGGGAANGVSLVLNMRTGQFEHQEPQYERKNVWLDEYISKIELDISEYEDAIKRIDSQITVLQALKNTPIESFTSKSVGGNTGSSSTSTKEETIKEVEAYIAVIDQYREAVERLNKTRMTVSEIERKLDDSTNLREQIILQEELISAYSREQEALLNLNSQRSATIRVGAEALHALGFEVAYNAEKDELWIENLEHLNELTADSQGEYETMQEATNALRKETENLIDSITDLNEANQKDSESWRDLGSSVLSAKNDIKSLMQEIVDEASSALNSIRDVYDALHSAADEYADTGYISIETMQKVIELGGEYMAYLVDENGELVINEERIRNVIAARTEQLAIESSLAYVESLRIAQEENDIETLDRLLYATERATDASWGLVYANLQLLHLSDGQYNAALSNINAMRAIAENAIQGIGVIGKSVKDELNDMKSGLNDILKYVMDMLKQKIDDQIGALELEKKKYGDIVSLQKESLKNAKEQADYQKNIAAKVKEIAQLQARVDALSLDSSREAQNERAGLLEELGKLQEDLADEQAEHSIDAQEKSLDKMEKAFHDEKDAEITTLQSNLTSYQQLYDAAIEYIGTHWDTLYSELISWNTQYGSVLNSDITSAWENCLSAAQRYGDYVSALHNIDTDISAAGTSGQNLSLGETRKTEKVNNEEMITAIVNKVRGLSAQWSRSNTKALNDSLHEKAVLYMAELDQYGVHAKYDPEHGTWTISRDDNKPSNVGKLVYDVYHAGGIVGGGSPQANEKFALLKDKEWVLSEEMVRNLSAQIANISRLRASFDNIPDYVSKTDLANVLKHGSGSTTTVTNNSNRGGDVSVNVPVQVYPLQKMDAAEISHMTDSISDATIKKVNESFAKRGVSKIRLT